MHKVLKAMDNQATIQYNRLKHLDISVVMYGVYNGEMLENLFKKQCIAYIFPQHFTQYIYVH